MSHLGIGQAMYGRRWSAQDRAVFMQTVDKNSSAKEGGGEEYKLKLEEARSSVEKGSVLTNPRDGSEFSSASEYRLCQTRHVRMFKDPIEKYTQSVKPRTTSQEYGWRIGASQPLPLAIAERAFPGHEGWEFSRKGCAETAFKQKLMQSGVEKPRMWFSTGAEANSDYSRQTPYILRKK